MNVLMRFIVTRAFKSKGFTLAEVLITLGIIGVVAAITIPTLMQNSQDKEKITALKKTYSTLSQAFSMAKAENGDPTNWDYQILILSLY